MTLTMILTTLTLILPITRTAAQTLALAGTVCSLGPDPSPGNTLRLRLRLG